MAAQRVGTGPIWAGHARANGQCNIAFAQKAKRLYLEKFKNPIGTATTFASSCFQATNQPPPTTEPHRSCFLAFLLLSQHYCIACDCVVKRFWLSGCSHVSLLIVFFYAVENHIVKRSLNTG